MKEWKRKENIDDKDEIALRMQAAEILDLKHPSPEINVHPNSVPHDRVTSAIDEFIAQQTGDVVRIIPGIGTGKLKEMVRAHLESNEYVERIIRDEGGSFLVLLKR